MTDGKIQPETGGVNQPRTLFKPGSWLSKIDFINHLILFNNVLITVLSEKQGGKTSFNTLLQNNLDQQIKAVTMTVQPPCDRQDIISNIAAQLHLNHDSNTDFASIAAQINERKAHVLIIIDDAQHLPESLIKEAMIAIKSQESFGFFHLCLISDYSVVATLNRLAVEQFDNLIHTIELGGLNESETRTYVLQRAMAARLIHRPLTDVQYKQFYQQTRGNLAKINSNLESFILNSSVPKKSNKSLLLKSVSMVVAASVVAGLSYMYSDVIYNKFQNSIVENKIVDTPKAESVISTQLASYIASWQDSSTVQFVHYGLPKRQNLDDMVDEEQNINTVAIVDKVIVIPTVKAKNLPVTQQNPDVREAVVAESQLVKLVLPSQNRSAPKVVAQITRKTALKNAAPKSKNSALYTIQLIASHKASDVNRFRKSNKLFAKTTVRHFTNAKGTWYILTIGEYESRTQAQQKASSLPAELAKLNPWIRPVSGLKNIG